MKYTPIQREQIQKKICDNLEFGESLEEICIENNLPVPTTIMSWIKKNAQFRKDYTRAREVGFIFKSLQLLEIADNSGLSKEEIAKASLQVSTRQWILSRLLPKKYGNMATQNNTQINITQITGMKIVDDTETIEAEVLPNKE